MYAEAHVGSGRFAQVAVIGTGMMGPGIALALAQGGCRVALIGRTATGVERGLARVDGALRFQVELCSMARDAQERG